MDNKLIGWFEFDREVGASGNSMFAEVSGHDNVKPKKGLTKHLDTIKTESFLKDERVDTYI